jgi:surfeit locus 1 family protein
LGKLSLTRSGIVGTALALAVAAVCIRLGVWQLDRLEQRRDRNAALAERLAAAPVSLPVVPNDTAGLLYRRVLLEGRYDDGRTIVLRGRMHRGMPGVHLITPLRLAGGGTVMVNRGWWPSPDGRTAILTELEPDAAVALVGVAQPFPLVTAAGDPEAVDAVAGIDESIPRAWLRLDGGALRRTLPYPIADFYVQALPEERAPSRLPGSAGASATGEPVRLPPPDLSEGPHLSYAVQWFGFGLIAIVVNGALLMLTAWIGGLFGLGFEIANFWPSAVLGALVIGAVSWLLSLVVKGR